MQEILKLQTKQNATVNSVSTAFARQYEDASVCADLQGGTEAMRIAGNKYIFTEDGESKAEYNERVKRTVLRNIFDQTVKYCAGQVFSRQVVLDNSDNVLTDEAFEQFLLFSENCDREGHNITSWASKVFSNGIVNGVTFALIDFPSVVERDNNGVREYQGQDGAWRIRNAAAEKQEGWAPYFVMVDAKQVLDCRGETRNGKQIITHFRYRSDVMEQNPDNQWGEVAVSYIRCYWTDHWEVWRKAENESSYTLYQQGQMSLNEIPLVCFMPGEKRTSFTARPSFMDLAWLNIRHWQATSEQYSLLAFARRPPWYMTGVTPEVDDEGNAVKIPFGPGRLLYLPENGKLSNVGVDAASIEAGRQDLKDLEEAMASYGMQALKRTSYNMTATQADRESRENNSRLQNWALDFQDFLENCLMYVAKWWGLEDGPSAKLNDTFGKSANVEYILQLFDKGLISKETMSTLMMRAGVLPDDFDFEQEADKLAQDLGENGSEAFNSALSGFLNGTNGKNESTAMIGTNVPQN